MEYNLLDIASSEKSIIFSLACLLYILYHRNLCIHYNVSFCLERGNRKNEEVVNRENIIIAYHINSSAH